MLKVSRETMCWQKQTMLFFYCRQESFTWNIRQIAWKTGEQTFLCFNFDEKMSFEHDFAAIGGVFNDIFWYFTKFCIFLSF